MSLATANGESSLAGEDPPALASHDNSGPESEAISSSNTIHATTTANKLATVLEESDPEILERHALTSLEANDWLNANFNLPLAPVEQLRRELELERARIGFMNQRIGVMERGMAELNASLAICREELCLLKSRAAIEEKE